VYVHGNSHAIQIAPQAGWTTNEDIQRGNIHHIKEANINPICSFITACLQKQEGRWNQHSADRVEKKRTRERKTEVSQANTLSTRRRSTGETSPNEKNTWYNKVGCCRGGARRTARYDFLSWLAENTVLTINPPNIGIIFTRREPIVRPERS
jgi:hypothetical protein